MYTTDPEQPEHTVDQPDQPDKPDLADLADLADLPPAIHSESDDQPVEVAADSATAPRPTAPVTASMAPAYAPRPTAPVTESTAPVFAPGPARWPAEPLRTAVRARTPRVVPVAVGVLVAVALVGLGAVKLRGALTPPPAPTRVASQPTATAHVTATAVPTMPNFSVPKGTISFGVSGASSSSQTCAGTAALPPLTIYLGNGGNVAVDWWIEVKQTLPDGKTLWTGTAPPYNTLPAGQSDKLELQPDARLCDELIGHSGSVQYTATVYYGGTGGFTITDTIVPPPPGTPKTTPPGPPVHP